MTAHSVIVLVTGCSKGGIGAALCEEFVRQGCKVYATARNMDSMQNPCSPHIEKLVLDVTSDGDVQRVIDHILKTESRIDVVVNNAGALAAGPLVDQPLEFAAKIFNTNTLSILRVSKAVIPSMAASKSGVIVNIGSVVGELATPWNGLYSATKAAVQKMSEVLSMECKPFGISVMHVSPGAVQSNLSDNQIKKFSLPSNSLYKSFLEDIIARIHASQASNRMPTDEFARRVVSQVIRNKALRRNPPTYMTLGGNTTTFSIMKWLPMSWVLSIMWWVHTKHFRARRSAIS